MRTISIVATTLVIFLIMLTPYVINNWKISREYVAFAVVLLCFSGVTCIIYHKKLKNSSAIICICVLFEVLLLGFMMIIDVFPYPDAQCIFTPMFLAVCPTLFILPYYVIHPILFLSEFVFIILELEYKSETVVSIDIFHSMVGLVFGFVLSIIITNIRVSEYKIKNNHRTLSQVDALTGVFNKSTSESFIRNYISMSDLGEVCALMIIDIDNFKSINDNYGHAAGDQVLSTVGKMLSDMFRPNDIVVMFGGDEFVVLIKKIDDDKMIEKKCLQLKDQLAHIQVGETSFSITCSIGIAKKNGSYMPYDDLFQYADNALYEAKRFGKNRFIIYSPREQNIISGKKYILIVDDLEIERVVLAETFRDEFEILEASSGREALDILSQYSKYVAVVFLDIYMDDLNGFDVLNFMKSCTYTQRIPVIVITSDPDSEEKALLYGAQDMLHKPIEPAVAKLRVNNILKRN